ncbi:MAG: TerC family protein [Bacteriovoracia bacterium]
MLQNYWPWIGFHLFLFAALALDLGVFHKKAHEIKFKEALSWSAVWFSLALLFNGGIWFFRGKDAAITFLTGYVIEWSLSVDNLFVFLTIFSAFAVPSKLQHRVLFWGILGALVMRAIFIFGGIALLKQFHWIVYIFGAFLLVTGIKLAFGGDAGETDPRERWIVKFATRWFRFSDRYDGGKFITIQNGRRLGTPLLMVLIIVEVTDLVFAADSIPAILAISSDPFIVYTSNIFAILGLRSLYFALAGLMSLFAYLRYGLATVLSFVGIKLCLTDIYKISPGWSLIVILICLGAAILYSVIKSRKDPAAAVNSPRS